MDDFMNPPIPEWIGATATFLGLVMGFLSFLTIFFLIAGMAYDSWYTKREHSETNRLSALDRARRDYEREELRIRKEQEARDEHTFDKIKDAHDDFDS